jgi:hypothetical protein
MRAVIGCVAAVAIAAASGARAECTFSDLTWARDGASVRLRVQCDGQGGQAAVDVASGQVTAVEPRVQEPVWSAARRSVLFRDVLGVFEIAPTPGAECRLRLFLPDAVPRFLRAFGADADGRLLLWTYERDGARHELWTETAATTRSALVEEQGPEALRWWRAHDTGKPFARAGGRFVRTVCARFGQRPERVCVEPTGRGSDGRTRFQLVLGKAGEMAEWARDVVPTGLAIASDSSAAIVGLEETLADGPRTTIWVVGPDQARRVATGAAPAGLEARIHWLDASTALWVDSAGELWRVDVGAASATALVVPRGATAAAAAMHRVVVAKPADADSAAALVQRLADAGFEAGSRRDGSAYEVQAGATPVRAEAETRAATLRARGFAPRIVTGPAAAVAPGIAFGSVASSTARRAFVRNVETKVGAGSELWLQEGGGAPRRLVSAAAATP